MADRVIKFQVTDDDHRLIRMAAAGADQSLAQFALEATIATAKTKVQAMLADPGTALGSDPPRKSKRSKS